MRIEDIMDSLEEGFIAIDETGKIIAVNKAYSKIIGVSTDKIKGKYLQVIEEGAMLLKVLKTGIPYKSETQYIVSVDKYVSAKMFPVFHEGILSGAFSIFQDKTELNTLYQKVNHFENVVAKYKNQLETMQTLEKFQVVGRNAAFVDLVGQTLLVAKTDATVLIRGENGVGKEVFARIIHKNSIRADKKLITVNCASIPENLIESELFGYEDGAFTGAKKGGKKGKFEMAEGGTLFLDEIGDMPIVMQSKILRVLQEGEIEKIGRNENIPINVRVITATNQPLEQMLKEKRFREDLYYRLNVVSIEVPPLRKRKNDIILIANYYLEQYNLKYRKQVKLNQSLYDFFLEYEWPGNVRQLQNCIEFGVIMCEEEITLKSLPASIRSEISESVINKSSEKLNLEEKNQKEYGLLKVEIEEYEKEIIIKTLKKCNGNKKETMELLGVSRRTFFRKLKKLGINEK